VSRAAASTLTAERAREVLAYCHGDGSLTWRITLSRARVAGKSAGYRRRDGYLHIGVDGQMYLGHRLVWLIVTGAWPTCEVDHIDGDRTNNRFVNLRDVDMSGNAQNRCRPQGKNPYLGVSWDAEQRKWRAGIRVNGRRKCLGRFDDPAVAHQRYLEAKAKLHIPTVIAKTVGAA